MATLKSLVNETTNIKNELKTCHTNLKDNLISKGVTILNSDKMINLSDKIKLLRVISNIPTGGESNLLYQYTNTFTHKGDIEGKMCEFTYTGNNGTVRLSTEIRSYASKYITDVIIRITRNGNSFIVNTLTRKGTSYTLYSCDIDVLDGDIISVGVKTEPYYECNVTNLKITYDYLIL